VIGELNNEEVECAQKLDELDSIEWWVRNSERKPTSFCLPLAKGYYYPDFLAKLTNGTLLAIEYKGKHLAEYDKEKRQIGELWARRSEGKCRFAWVVDKDWQVLMQATNLHN
jgi:type III restriction enzyme